MSSWHTITLKGRSQVIPPVCPNCLAPASVEVETEHRFLNNTHTQTFLYCEPCGKQASAFPSIWFSGMLGLIVGLVPALTFVFAIFPKLPEGLKKSDISGALPLIMLAACVVGLPLMRRRAFKKAHPHREGQAVQGPAVYYVGPGDLLGLGNSACYKAARPEWVREFVRRNPDQVDAAAYAQWTGEAPPHA